MQMRTGVISAFKASPLLVVVGVVSLVVFGLSFIQYASRGGFWSPKVEARVFTEDRAIRDGESVNGSQRRFVLQGEVYGDAGRLQESAAIALAGMLVAADRTMNTRPIQDVESLLNQMIAGEAVPPGIEYISSKKCLSSGLADYYLRYRQSPLGVEVISECKGASCGPTFLVRLPDDGFSQDAMTYYTAPSSGNAAVPAAFVSAAEVIKAGWHPQTFRAQVPQ